MLYFGVVKELFGCNSDAAELPEGSSVEDLLELLQGGLHKVPEVWRFMAVAVNREYAGKATVLREGDEVALLPPVSGGVQ